MFDYDRNSGNDLIEIIHSVIYIGGTLGDALAMNEATADSTIEELEGNRGTRFYNFLFNKVYPECI